MITTTTPASEVSMNTAVGHRAPLRRLARRFPVTTFVVLAFVITWSVWVPRALVSQGYLDSQWPMTLGSFWTYGPAVAAVLAAWLTAGPPGFRELASRLVRWRVGGHWYAVVLLGPAAFWVLVVAIDAALGWSEELGRPLIVEHGLAAALPLLLYIALPDGLGEEPGWRGYALPRQLERLRALPASLAVGVVWAVWHLPLFWTRGTSLYGSSPWILLLELPALSVLFSWVFLHTRDPRQRPAGHPVPRLVEPVRDVRGRRRRRPPGSHPDRAGTEMGACRHCGGVLAPPPRRRYHLGDDPERRGCLRHRSLGR
jgi:uncharacterized protein